MLLALQLIKIAFSQPENVIFFCENCGAFNINLHYATSVSSVCDRGREEGRSTARPSRTEPDLREGTLLSNSVPEFPKFFVISAVSYI